MTMSTTGGATWSAPVKVNDDLTTNDQWQPTIAVTPDGSKLGIFYSSRQEDTTTLDGDPVNNQFKYYGRIGSISGSTVAFASSFAVSSVASKPEVARDSVINTTYMGDYNQAVATPGAFHAVWSDNRLPLLPGGGTRSDPNVYYQKIALGLAVTTTVPAVGSIISSQPTSFTVNVTDPVDATSLQASDLTVNGTPATSVSYTPGSTTILFTYGTSPVVSQGVQSMAIGAGAFTRASDGNPVAAFSGTFRYDAVLLQVVSTIPPFPNGVFTLPAPFTYDVNFNEVVDPASVQTGDLLLSGIGGAVVTGVTVLAGNTTARFTIGNITTEGTLTASITAGAITDAFGNPGAAFSATYSVDIGTVPYPIPLTSKQPLGSLIYDPSISGNIGFVGDTDSFTLAIDPSQTVTVLVTPTSATLHLTVTLRDPSNAVIGGATGVGPGQKALLQTAATTTGGTYTITVGAVAGTTGNYTVQVILNAAQEMEGTLPGLSNNSLAMAQDINASFVTLQTPQASAQRGAVLGTSDSASYTAAAVTPAFVDISTTGTISIATGDDSAQVLSGVQLAGFAFPFFGTTFTSVGFSTNGLMTFPSGDSTFSNSDLSTSPSQAAIAVLWDDLFNDNTGTGTTSQRIFWQVVGSGSNQQLIVQWNNIRQLGGSLRFTFQAVLSANGNIQLNYGSGVTTGAVVGSATVGVKAAGTSNPARLLISFNQAQGPLVGPNLSTLITPPIPGPDYYSFTLGAGETTTVAVTGLSSGNLNLELRNGSDAILATGVGGATNLTKVISNFVASTAGTYFARVTGDGNVPYSLLATRNAAFDTEDNNTFAMAQTISGTQGVLGHIGGGGIGAGTAQVGYFTDFNQFTTSPAATIVQAGFTPIQITDISTFNLTTIDILMVDESNNGGLSSAMSARLPSIQTWVQGGGIFMVHDRFVSTGVGSNPFLLGAPTAVANRNFTFGADLDVIPPGGTLVTSGPFGTITNTTLDGGNFSNHGWVTAGTLPGGTAMILSAGPNTANVAALSYTLGSGRIYYSTIPLDFYLTQSGTGQPGANLRTIYTPNTLRYVNSFRIPPEDWFSITVTSTANALRLETSTPADGPGQPDNTLNPKIELYNPSNVLVASGTAMGDGRNEFIQYQPLVAGTYRVRVIGEANTKGEYFLTKNFSLVLSGVTVTSPINENDTATLSGAISDPDALDSHTVTINWGPGEGSTTLTLAAGVTSFTATHQYLDDNPTGTPSDTIPIELLALDLHGASGTASTSVTVNNVAPSVVISGPTSANEGTTQSYTYDTTDPGTQDTFTHSVSCGLYGTLSNDLFSSTTGDGSFDCTFPDGPASSTVSVTVTDDDTGSGSDSKTVTIMNVAPVVSDNCAQMVQYSDPISSCTITATDVDGDTLTAMVIDPFDGPFASPGPTADLTLTSLGCIDNLSNSLFQDCMWTLAGEANLDPLLPSPPGVTLPDTFNAVKVLEFENSTDTTPASTTDTAPITVNKEGADANYTSFMAYSTPCADLTKTSCTTATVVLSSTVRDISAATGYPVGGDVTPGAITNATLTFKIVGGATLCSVPVGLVGVNDSAGNNYTIGSAACTATLTVPSSGVSAGFAIYDIAVIVNGYYTFNAVGATTTMVNISAPFSTNFITGGGQLLLSASTGSLGPINSPGTPNWYNFGFNVKFNKNGTNLQGNFNSIVRSNTLLPGHTAADAVCNTGPGDTALFGSTRLYQLKSTALGSLNVTMPNKGELTAKASVTDVTDPANKCSLDGYGGSQLKVSMEDNGEPGSTPGAGPDKIFVASWKSTANGGSLSLSSNWSTTTNSTVLQLLDRGNLQVHGGLELAGAAASNPTGAKALTSDQLQRFVAEALAQWQSAGVDAQRLQSLGGVTFEITDLAPGALGVASVDTVWIDQDASGYGWFLGNSGTVPGARVDLLTVVTHEVGHLLGLGHSDTHGVMEGALEPGVRLLPTASHAGIDHAGVALVSASKLRAFDAGLQTPSVCPEALGASRAEYLGLSFLGHNAGHGHLVGTMRPASRVPVTSLALDLVLAGRPANGTRFSLLQEDSGRARLGGASLEYLGGAVARDLVVSETFPGRLTFGGFVARNGPPFDSPLSAASDARASSGVFEAGVGALSDEEVDAVVPAADAAEQAIDEVLGSVGPEGLSLGSLAVLLGVVGGFVRGKTKEETKEAERAQDQPEVSCRR